MPIDINMLRTERGKSSHRSLVPFICLICLISYRWRPRESEGFFESQIWRRVNRRPNYRTWRTTANW